MAIGKITASKQSAVMVKVRPETGDSFETHNGTIFTNYQVIDNVGQKFHADSWISRLKIKLGTVPEYCEVSVSIYDTAQKTKLFCQEDFMINAGNDQILHLIFDPIQPGDYYWELKLLKGTIGVSVCTNSTLGGAYKEGSSTTDWDIESKLMIAADALEERAIAVIGDEVDNKVTETSTGSEFNFIKVESNEKAVCREGDSLSNGGKILSGCWSVEEG